jgi:hypothetical protein
MKTPLFPAPGERRTTIVVWDIHDPSKKGDARYWWDETEVARLRELSPDMPDLNGKPRGRSLAALRREAEDDEVELGWPELPDGSPAHSVRISLSRWRDADPESTYLIVTHGRRPTDEEQEVLRAKGFPWPEAVETLRQEWLAAIAAQLTDRATELRQQLDAAFKEQGFFKFGDRSPWDPERATELQPGGVVQDDRPEATGS